MTRSETRSPLPVITLPILALFVLGTVPWFGAVSLSPTLLFDSLFTEQHTILFSLRIPRVFMAFFVGAGLALCGVTFQALFRNALASPFTLGISGGAAFGTSLSFHFAPSAAAGTLIGVPLGAGIGVAVTVILLLLVARREHLLFGNGLLLTGVVMNFFFGSLTLFVQYVSDFTAVFRTSRWMMGSVATVGYGQLALVAFATVLLTMVLWFKRHALDLISLGDEFAQSRGVSLSVDKRTLLIIVSVATGIIVACVGPIGFVGIMMPHLARQLVGARHTVLLPASLCLGGILLVVCDLVSRTLIAPYEIPVGVLTALLGGPFFLWVFFRQAGNKV